MKKEPRNIKPSEWKIIDKYFKTFLAAYNSGEIDEEIFRGYVTHYIGVAQHEGIDSVITGMNNTLANIEENGFKLP
ncbi:hypothetical protein K1X45_13395 [Pseudochrobactrum sp. Wa41.01b-1]|uniref:hypothetical protein n=1 Tax=Pseudochrobactrum sp. Wa41.01b-1 TaxID=2864102 RepID=UPI001C68ADE3|nr:hypothetical protein [Pseudochrobactrum sp. Wa41.01b-1]QYM72456.1 hypothetical protein K1X45_13395 [Pseudochrobactrum sp. Wa41.01b-1]